MTLEMWLNKLLDFIGVAGSFLLRKFKQIGVIIFCMIVAIVGVILYNVAGYSIVHLFQTGQNVALSLIFVGVAILILAFTIIKRK